MKDPKKVISFSCRESELKALDKIAKGIGVKRSEAIRILCFMQMAPDVCDWFLPLAKSKGVAPWEYLNVILRTFKQACLQADDKRLVLEGS